MFGIILYLICWSICGFIAIRIFDWIDDQKTCWKSYLIGAISGPAGLVLVLMYTILYVVLKLSLKLYDVVQNLIKGIK